MKNENLIIIILLLFHTMIIIYNRVYPLYIIKFEIVKSKRNN